ncbi:uncharacterized protein LOC111457208 isoform X1 [Cucurbita moschata]|uniref:Uncharacterized protein LOC111457208 isoform X1 n=1 Tax=Cucurbita moschata TaxID=3662 RepID=A0A6J1GST6_CUCMO|nr:uncharacterized protein LOC111457208 isoform X1 [Cucurbita moschata]
MRKERNPRPAETDPTNSPDVALDKPSLRQVILLISSLISLSHSVKVFASKWKLIRDKLEELNSGLIAADNCDSDETPAISDLIRKIIGTVTECDDLARRCVDLSFSGKLLMQSDLDVICAKFDRHAKKLSEIYTAGILSQGFAIVVSRPGLGACKDDMRFYVRDIVTRMKVGCSDLKRQALVNLLAAVTEDEKYVKVIIEIGEIVNLLVNFLGSPETELQEAALQVLHIISGFDSYKAVLVGNGVIAPLIRVMECGSAVGKKIATRCLMKFTENSENAWSVSAHGGVTALLKICSNSDSKTELISPACGVLNNLVGVEEIKRFMIEEGAISTFIRLSRSREDSVQINSIVFLQNIAYGDESVNKLLVKEGGIRGLVRVLDPKSCSSSKTLEAAMQAIENICFSSVNYVNILINYGFMENLLHFLRNGDVSLQGIALKVAVKLSETSEEAKKAMGDGGFMPEFVKFLGAKSFEVREMAAEALSAMVMIPKNRKRFAQDNRNVETLLQMLDTEEVNSGNKRFLFSILNSLTGSSSGRRKIVNSGYMKNIEKLAESEVYDAKKLIRKLSTNKFRSLLNGIWHT